MWLLVVVVIVAVVAYRWWCNSQLLNLKCNEHYILITGCDTGFGYQAAKRLDRMGFNVFAACLTTEKATELSSQCSARLIPLALNVTSDASIEEALQEVSKKLPSDKGLWAVINNAGVSGTIAASEWMKKDQFQNTLSVNLFGITAMTKAFLPLLQKGKGRAIFVGSVLGRVALIPPAYVLSKHCLEAYVDRFRREQLKLSGGRGVKAVLIEPGGYRTNITASHQMTAPTDRLFNSLDEDIKNYYGADYKTNLIKIFQLLEDYVWGRNPEEVVDAYIHAVMASQPKNRYVVSWNGNLLFRLLWTLPAGLVDAAAALNLPQPAGA